MNLFECTCNNCEARFITALESSEESCSCPSCESENVSREEINPEEFGCGGGCSSCSGCH